MLKVKVEKDTKHGGFIAREDSDNPLRRIAAAGDTEEQAVAALFEYHADLIRKGRVKLEEVNAVREERYFCHIGDYAPDVGPYPIEEHGSIITTPLKMRALAVSEGLIEQKGTGNESLVCKILRQCMLSNGYSSSLILSLDTIRWFQRMLKNHVPHGKLVHGSKGTYFETVEDVDVASPMVMTFTARNLFGYEVDNISPGLQLNEGDVCDFLKALLSHPTWQVAEGKTGLGILSNMDSRYIYLWSAINLKCGLPSRITKSGQVVD
jgi:hypothetical protein